MNIDKAIEQLQQAKKQGTKTIIFAFWEASLFDRKDDDDWETLSEFIEDEMDWANCHDQIADIIETYGEEEV